MNFENLIKPLVTSCFFAISIIANAEDPEFNQPSEYNFITVRGGVVQPTSLGGNAHLDSAETTYTGGIEIGRKFMDIFAVGVEYNYRGESDFSASDGGGTANSSWSAKSDALMLNLSVDLVKNSRITPYVKAGVGVSRNQSSDYVSGVWTGAQNAGSHNTYTYPGKAVNKFAWQLGAGVNVYASDMFDTDISYMFVNRGKVETGENYRQRSQTGLLNNVVSAPARSGTLQEHIVTIGLKIKF